MKKMFIIIIILLNFTYLMADITVKGKAMIALTSEDFEYENIKIYFLDVNTGNIIDSTLTDKNGFYIKKITKEGTYDIIFLKNNLYGIFKDIELYSSIFIKERQLNDMILRDSKLFKDIDLLKDKMLYYPDLMLLQNAGKNLRSFTRLTYIGLGLSIVGSIIIIESKDDNTKIIGWGVSTIGSIIGLIAPSKVGIAGKNIEEYMKLKYIEKQKNIIKNE
ncbi:MAG: hypothetical protein H8D22_10630 [Candidatus Cloacimonetes bacterium]|nr:hypothetical protein [Candidatus Cloacimonadota bacterium]